MIEFVERFAFLETVLSTRGMDNTLRNSSADFSYGTCFLMIYLVLGVKRLG